MSWAIFDCPEHSHTSPITIFVKVIEFVPLTIICRDELLISIESSVIFQEPPEPVITVFVCPLNWTDTLSPELAVPQTGTSIPCCKTILLLKILFTVTFGQVVTVIMNSHTTTAGTLDQLYSFFMKSPSVACQLSLFKNYPNLEIVFIVNEYKVFSSENQLHMAIR